MLVAPVYSRYARMVAIDPGSNCMGVATIDFDCITKAIVASQAFTIDAKRLFINDSYDESFGNRLARINAMQSILSAHYCTYRPSFAACESPFIGMKKPQAYGSLMETVCGVRAALATYDPYMPLLMIDPPSAKVGIGAAGYAKKDAVLAALLKLPNLNYLGGLQAMQSLDEHSVDALAVGVTVVNRILNGHYT